MDIFLFTTYKKVAIDCQYLGENLIKNVIIFEKRLDRRARACYIGCVPDKGAQPITTTKNRNENTRTE